MATMEKELERIRIAHELHWKRLDALEIISMLANELVNTIFPEEEDALAFCCDMLEGNDHKRIVAQAGISYFTEPTPGVDDNYKARAVGILAGVMAAGYSRFHNPLGFMGLVGYWERMNCLERGDKNRTTRPGWLYGGD